MDIRPLCYFYHARGWCRHGSNCHYKHEIEDEVTSSPRLFGTPVYAILSPSQLPIAYGYSIFGGAPIPIISDERAVATLNSVSSGVFTKNIEAAPASVDLAHIPPSVPTDPVVAFSTLTPTDPEKASVSAPAVPKEASVPAPAVPEEASVSAPTAPVLCNPSHDTSTSLVASILPLAPPGPVVSFSPFTPTGPVDLIPSAPAPVSSAPAVPSDQNLGSTSPPPNPVNSIFSPSALSDFSVCTRRVSPLLIASPHAPNDTPQRRTYLLNLLKTRIKKIFMHSKASATNPLMLQVKAAYELTEHLTAWRLADEKKIESLCVSAWICDTSEFLTKVLELE
ncbi:hypothetical protein ElyMa_002534200 [Elysia marginata]|uniref:C3H1-type domain-containing protein n=1 Tax=Elysia marginata TaxID=1093978 RepID=A0AAV4GTC9_9GAST|nr:hypothetical protein ElyMa_002534200 [Elysia marginata]